MIGASGRDPEPPPGPLVAPYAVETILDELTMPTPVVRGGEVQMLHPMTPAGVVEFGDPVGPAETVYSIHSEQATFTDSFGAREVAFQLSLDPNFLAKVRLLSEIGIAATDPSRWTGRRWCHGGCCSRCWPGCRAPSRRCARWACTASRPTGRAGTAVVECVTRAVEGLGFGGGIASTACPPAVVAGMICRGELTHRGVLPSERAVGYGPLFERLKPTASRCASRRREAQRCLTGYGA